MEMEMSYSFVRKNVTDSIRDKKIFTIIKKFRRRGIWWVEYYVSAKDSRLGIYSREMGTYECPESEFRASTQLA